MTKFLLTACAAALIGAAVPSALAGESGNGRSGAIIQADSNRYYYSWSYPVPGYGYGNIWNRDRNRDRGWGNGWGYGYGNHGVVAPRWIVHNLSRHKYRNITKPVLAGRFYQVKATDPRGRKVKLYIDAYTGEIARRKFRG